MSLPLLRYSLDHTGVNPDNYIKNELAILAKHHVRAIVPVYAPFFGEVDTLHLVEKSTGKILVKGIHYVTAGMMPGLTQEIGKEISSFFLIIDIDISSPIEVSYQTVGGEHTLSAETLISLLSMKVDDNQTYVYDNIGGKPDTFKPTPHKHDIGDIVGFEFLAHTLERLRNAIIWSDSVAFENVLFYISKLIKHANQVITTGIDTCVGVELVKFKSILNKTYMSLENVLNLQVANYSTSKAIAQKEFTDNPSAADKYISLNSLAAFKEILFENMVRKLDTGIGNLSGTVIHPLRNILLSAPTGFVALLETKSANVQQSKQVDKDVYPIADATIERYAIQKISVKDSDNSGIFMAVNRDRPTMHLGTSQNTPNDRIITWERYLLKNEVDHLEGTLRNHVEKKENPHKLVASQVNLGKVENLEVVSREELFCRTSVRKYVTYDMLVLFMEAFIALMKPKEAVVVEPTEEKKLMMEINKVLVNPQACYSCDCEEPPPAAIVPDFSIFDWTGNLLIGKGYTLETTDPSVTVQLKDAFDAHLCYIYPTTSTGHTVEIQDYTGTVIGYACDPV